MNPHKKKHYNYLLRFYDFKFFTFFNNKLFSMFFLSFIIVTLYRIVHTTIELPVHCTHIHRRDYQRKKRRNKVIAISGKKKPKT